MTLDPRAMVPPTMLAISKSGFGLRFATAQHAESPRSRAALRAAESGRRDPRRPAVQRRRRRGVRTQNGHVLHCKADEIAKLEGPGRGVTVIKTAENDAVIGFIAVARATCSCCRPRRPGKDHSQKAIEGSLVARRQGRQVVKKTTLVAVPRPVTIQPWRMPRVARE